MTRKLAVLLFALGTHGTAFAASAKLGCDILQVRASLGAKSFYGSAVPLVLGGARILVTADHVFPFDLTSENSNGLFIQVGGRSAKILKRDWATDLMILAFNETESASRFQSCRISAKRFGSGANLKMAGYLAGSSIRVVREAQVLDSEAPEVRAAARINLIKARGEGEKGMSGGALLDEKGEKGEIAGLLLQDWVNPNHLETGGVYALPASALEEAVNALLSSEESERVLPFEIRRGIPEMSAFGFRFRPGIEDAGKTLSSSLVLAMGGGSGHPDGIGGEASRSVLEVVGLSGEPVPIEWLPMLNILKRIQSEGGSQMLVRSTEDGMPAGSLVELGRLLMETPGVVPRLDFVVQDLPTHRASNNGLDLDSLAERAVILSSVLAEKNSEVTLAARQVRVHYTEWVRTHEISRIRELIKEAQAVSRIWVAAVGESPESAATLIDFQVTLLRIEKALGRVTRF